MFVRINYITPYQFLQRMTDNTVDNVMLSVSLFICVQCTGSFQPFLPIYHVWTVSRRWRCLCCVWWWWPVAVCRRCWRMERDCLQRSPWFADLLTTSRRPSAPTLSTLTSPHRMVSLPVPANNLCILRRNYILIFAIYQRLHRTKWYYEIVMIAKSIPRAVDFTCLAVIAGCITPCPEKRCHLIFACNSAKCKLIFKILLPSHSAVNLQ